jgi:Protein of unknown function (DUF2934)
MTADRRRGIQERAYYLWLEEGRPHGRHDEHWRRAESELIEKERGLQEGSPVTAALGGDTAEGAPAGASGQAAPASDEDRPDDKLQATVHRKTKPRAPRSRPTASGSGSRSSRRPAVAKRAEDGRG